METATRPGYPEAVAMLVKIGDGLNKQDDVPGGKAVRATTLA
ncbi:hypothetical protein ACQR10_10140 [Bradyrhizobium sp. HKCCYLRH2060]|nr:hypothetical protein [Bradyrhizobium sp. SZCCHNR3003]